jgi:hypothetical protein
MMVIVCRFGEQTRSDDVPFPTSKTKESKMAGILLWLMGVPLVVILLLYLAF